ncbi:MAG TPA: N-acetyl-gamma-glutamyl-phosphate reductase [Planctomycetota bacterium]|nr:N-acetyl-gamma-glutamyl-phosphate reductase [Planctomycetota bacterium]
MIRVSIVGATGLVGECLIRALVGHPQCKLSMLVSDHAAGKKIGDLLPPLRGELDLDTVSAMPEEIAKASDIVFTAKKGSETFGVVPGLLQGGAKVIDIGGEFRFKDPAVYEKWYKEPHACKDLLPETVYGLPEVNKDQIKSARLVGNPGCYVTCALLALIPFVKAGVIDLDSIVVDAYSGLSGAGRQFNQKLSNLFTDIDGNMRAYNIGAHKHTPEIEQTLSIVAGKPVVVTFVPHLVPLDRGILSTIFARPKKGFNTAKALECLKSFYTEQNAPFVRVLNAPEDVAIGNVVRSNYCDISATVLDRSGQLVITSALDNLVKGAAGQALQNMNIMCGLIETAGLKGRSL